MTAFRFALLGAGKMATALTRGLLHAGIAASEIIAYDSDPEAAKAFREATGAAIAASPAELAAPNLILAVKPQYLEAALQPVDAAGKLVISIVAGVPLARLCALTGADAVVRAMPNTPALIGAGAGAYAVTAAVSEAQLQLVARVLAGCGSFFPVAEPLLDAVTGLSGSGPAYVFTFIQALADGGVAAGLPRDIALKLAAQTVAGSAQLVLETGTHPMALCDAVMSPGGTTAMGVLELARGAFSAVAAQAVLASAAKSAELGKR